MWGDYGTELRAKIGAHDDDITHGAFDRSHDDCNINANNHTTNHYINYMAVLQQHHSTPNFVPLSVSYQLSLSGLFRGSTELLQNTQINTATDKPIDIRALNRSLKALGGLSGCWLGPPIFESEINISPLIEKF